MKRLPLITASRLDRNLELSQSFGSDPTPDENMKHFGLPNGGSQSSQVNSTIRWICPINDPTLLRPQDRNLCRDGDTGVCHRKPLVSMIDEERSKVLCPSSSWLSRIGLKHNTFLIETTGSIESHYLRTPPLTTLHSNTIFCPSCCAGCTIQT